MHLSYSFSRYKGKKYKSYAIAESYREGKKVKKRTIWPIGKLADQQADQIRLIFKSRTGQGPIHYTAERYCSQRQQSLSGYRPCQRIVESLAAGSGFRF